MYPSACREETYIYIYIYITTLSHFGVIKRIGDEGFT